MKVDLSKLFHEFQEKNEEFKELLVADREGNFIFKTENISYVESTIKEVIEFWKHHHSSIELNEIRFSILKSDPYQFCAINVKSGNGICGSITKNGNYCLAFLKPLKKLQIGNSLIISSVQFNKWIWSLI